MTEAPSREALAAAFDLSRRTSSPAFRDWVEKHNDEPRPMLVALPDESQPFGYRFLTVVPSSPEWKATADIYGDPELLATLTDTSTIGDYGPVPAPGETGDDVYERR